MRIIESGKTKQMADLNMVPPRASGSSRGRHSGEGQGNAAKHDCKREKQLEDRGMAVCRRGQIDTFQTVTGEWVDFRISPQGIEAENLDDWNSRYGISWEQAAAILGAQFNQKGGLCCVYP